MQGNSKTVVDSRANANLPEGGLGMATNRKLGSTIFIPFEVVDAANVTNYKLDGKLLTKEQLAKKAFEFFTKYYDRRDVAEIEATTK